MIYLSNIGSVCWLRYDYLTKSGIQEKTIERWKDRKIIERTYIDGYGYVNYDTIPEPSRKKLPSKEELKKEYLRQRFSYEENLFLRELKEAYSGLNVPKWFREIQSMDLPRQLKLEEISKYASRAAVFERAIQLNRTYGRLSPLLYAFNTIYPDNGYSHPSRLKMALTKAEKEGVLSVAIDKRLFRKTEKKYGKLHEYNAFALLSDKKKYTLEKAYELFSELCQKGNIDIPSFGWFRIYYRENKNLINELRNGKTKDAPIYAKIIPALNAGSQWQMDGWTLPFWCKKPNGKGGYETFVRYVLFAVLDAHSRKIVGFSVAESENTETILRGLENAVKHTGHLPYEIIADNHSWNKTKIATNIKEKFDELKVHWTIDSNPRRKAILERAFRTLGDNHFKYMYGYTGQGVKTKLKNGTVAQELLDEYSKTKNMLLYEQVLAMTVKAIHDYNNSIIKKLKDTPNNLYKKSEKPYIRLVDDFARMALFFRESETTIRNGQITLNRGTFEKYEYQLPAEYYKDWNNKTVAYRRGDSFDHIYLYDIETGNSICSLSQKTPVHGSLSDQSDKDTESLYRNSGRINGINTKSRKQKEKLTEEANTINSAAFSYLNELTVSKETLSSVRQDYESRQLMAEDFGINPDSIFDLPVINNTSNNSLKPKEKEMCLPQNKKHKIKEVELNIVYDEDFHPNADQPFMPKDHQIKVFQFNRE